MGKGGAPLCWAGQRRALSTPRRTPNTRGARDGTTGRRNFAEAAPPGGPSGASSSALHGDSSDEFTQLVAALTEMLRMPTHECKRAARRLYLTWHPDKAPHKPHAARFFRIADRFARLMEKGKKEEAEAFIAHLRPDANEPDISDGYEEIEPHTWFAEFADQVRRVRRSISQRFAAFSQSSQSSQKFAGVRRVRSRFRRKSTE